MMNYIQTDPAFRERLGKHDLDRVERILQRLDGRIAAWSRTTDTLYIPPVTPDGVGFYLKRYFYPHWRNRLRGMFRGTFFGMHRGKAEARSLNTMRNLGVSAVRPVAFGWRRVAHFVAASFLITEEAPGAVNLTTFAQQLEARRRTLSYRDRRAMINELADAIAAMHAGGFAHGRLFWRNVLVRFSLAGQPEFFLLDAEPPRAMERLRRAQWRQSELAGLAASAQQFTTRSDRWRFLKRYFTDSPVAVDPRRFAHEVEQLAEHWRRHEAQRVRMNARFEAWNERLTRFDARRGRRGA